MTKKIDQLPVAGTLTGTELVELVQSGASVQGTAQDIADLGGGATRPSPVHLPIAFNTAGLAAGVVVWTPSVDSYIYNGWFEVNPAAVWDGTTPKGDFGDATTGFGLFQDVGGASADMTQVNNVFGGITILTSGYSLVFVAQFYGVGMPVLVAAGTAIKAWVTQNGIPGGASPASTQGSGKVVLLVGPR